MVLRDELMLELGRRCERNPNYSLRAFARDLGMDHASLSQMLRGRRRLSFNNVKRLGERLGFDQEKITAACTALDADALKRLVCSDSFKPDCRWIARRTGIPVDRLSIALQVLLSREELVMRATNNWHIQNQTHG